MRKKSYGMLGGLRILPAEFKRRYSWTGLDFWKGYVCMYIHMSRLVLVHMRNNPYCCAVSLREPVQHSLPAKAKLVLLEAIPSERCQSQSRK